VALLAECGTFEGCGVAAFAEALVVEQPNEFTGETGSLGIIRLSFLGMVFTVE